MSWLAFNFEKFAGYDGRKEWEYFPLALSQGKYKSFNTSKEDLSVLAEFIRQRRPLSVLECGTFEARTTEYLARTMLYHCPPPRKLITVDVVGCIDHINVDTVTYKVDDLYDDVLNIREHRLELLDRYEGIEVIYEVGLVKDYLPEYVSKVDFIYQDASHLLHLLQNEWEIIERSGPKPGLIICFDDMRNSEFVDWVSKRASKWIIRVNLNERGQLWMERMP